MRRPDSEPTSIDRSLPTPKIAALFAAIAEGYENDAIEGCCQFVVPGAEGDIRFFIRASAGKLSAGTGTVENVSATVTLPEPAIDHILSARETLDFRSPELATKVSLEGDWRLANELSTALKKTPDIVRTNYLSAARRCAKLPPLNEVPRLDNPDADQLAEVLQGPQPCVLGGLLSGWSVANWSFPRLASEFGDAQLATSSIETPLMSVADFVRSLGPRAGEIAYTGGCPVPEAMLAHFPYPLDARLGKTCAPTLWMGRPLDPAQPVTGLHRDAFCVLLGQVIGSKRVVLYGPDQAQFLYPVKAHNRNQGCRVEPWAPDLQRFPKFRRAHAVETTLEPGDLLLIPIGWFHCVFAHDATMSVSYLVFRGANVQLKKMFFPST